MNIEILLKKSGQLQRQAKSVVDNTRIVDVFSQIGRVNFVGSYKLGLMMRRDIDVIVITRKPNGDAARLATEKLKNSRKFSSVKMADAYTKKLPYAPRGYYWELKTKRPEGVWKFDVWYLVSSEDESIKPTKKWQRSLTSAKKELILAIKKEYLKTPMLYSHKLYGAKIYKAVLDRGIKDIETFHRRVALPARGR